MLTDTQKDMLQQPLDGTKVKTRKGGGNFQLSYIEGWWALAEANNIFGFDGWHRETIELRLIGEEQENGRWKVGYLAKVRVTVNGPEDREDLIREGVGFGNGIGPSRIDAHELAAKEAETDAVKRALSTFGWRFGLALYDKTQEHVEKDEPKKDAPPKTAIGSAVSGPIADGVEIEGNGQRPSGPSSVAVLLGTALTGCKTMSELQQIWSGHTHQMKGWHKEDKAYVTLIKNGRKAEFERMNPELVP